MRYDVPLADWLAYHHKREAAVIADELAAVVEPGRWWFRVERDAGAVWDRLCPAFHAVAAWNLHLVEPRFARHYRK